MNISDLTAAGLLGLLGTGHCLGMCGPLVLAFPGQHSRMAGHLAYHAGRIGTYVLIGTALGAIGQALNAPLLWMTQAQRLLALAAALLLAWLGLARLGALAEPRWMSFTPAPQGAHNPTVRAAAAGQGGLPALLTTGLLMGLLPCGLSYGAFAQALASRSALTGAALCGAFGLGTLPGLLAVGGGLGRLMRRHRRVSELLAGVLMLAMALRILIKNISALMA